MQDSPPKNLTAILRKLWHAAHLFATTKKTQHFSVLAQARLEITNQPPGSERTAKTQKFNLQDPNLR